MSSEEHVLVTGGAGYIGSNTCKALSRAGFIPITYDNLSTGCRSAVKWGPLEVGDILDTDSLATALRRYAPAGVIHFAAVASVSDSVGDPVKYYRNNTAGTLSLIDAMLRAGVDKIIASSSCSVYGLPITAMMPEAHPTVPVSPYGASKLMTERTLADCGNACGIRSICLRYFNAAGADAEGEAGEDHMPETQLRRNSRQADAETCYPKLLRGTGRS